MLDEHGRLKRRRHVPGATASGEDGQGVDAPTVSRAVRQYADPRFWHAIIKRRRLAALGVAAAAVAVLALIALAWAALVWPGTGEESESSVPASGRIPGTTPSARDATASVSASGGVPVSTGTPGAAAGQPAWTRAPLVAYRREGAIWVSDESGGNARRVVASTSGIYSLSPDGTRIALVDGAGDRLALVDVATGAKKDAGPASPVRPDWSPDSQWLVYSRPAGAEDEVVRMAAAGYGGTVLMRGARGRFVGGPDLVVAAPSRGTLPSQVVALFSDGRTVRIGRRISSVEVCPGPRGVYVVDAGDPTAPPSIRYVAFEGGNDLAVVPAPAADAQIALSNLSVSPDGRWLVYTETRDDGYSRMFARQATGLKVIPLKSHRDSYLVGWSADGTELLRIEGNAAQGEATRLTALHPDGTGWRVVIEGAGL